MDVCAVGECFGSKVRPRTFGCIAMSSALLFIDFPHPLLHPPSSFCIVKICDRLASCYNLDM